MTRELMDDAQAVAEVCALGSQIEKGLIEAEKATRTEATKATEAERELRRWKSPPNGGHDPEYQRAWALAVSRMPPIRGLANPMCPDRVLSDDGPRESTDDGFSEK